MKNNFSKRIFAVLAAVLLGTALCAPIAFADETDTNDYSDQTDYTDYTDDTNTDENTGDTVSAEDGNVDTTDTASADSSETETFFNELKADNGIGRTLFIAGAVCIVLGVGGIVCLIFWQRAGKKRDQNEADRAEVLDEIEQEERRNRRRREEERLRRERMQEREENVRPQSSTFDPNRDTGELPMVPAAAEYTVERPIVPETPVSMQPQNVRRAAPQPPVRRTVPAEKLQKSNAAVAPRTAATARPMSKPQTVPQQRPANAQPAKPTARPAQPRPTVQPVQAKPAAKPAAPQKAPEKYDLEDILREVREMNANK